MTNPTPRLIALLAVSVVAASCAVSKTEPPPLAGPSELSLSLSMSANPDVLRLDGASQSRVTVDARDENGQPKSNVPLRVETVADGQAVDFGTLSARTMVTGNNGRATFTFTAPIDAGGAIPRLQIRVTPTGTGDAASHTARVLSIRLVPAGANIPGGPTATFKVTPAEAGERFAFSDVLFDASESRAGLGAAILGYEWSFGDGSKATGVTTAHKFAAGTYTVTLTVTDSNGLSAASSQIVQVQPGTPPTAVVVFSPKEPKVGDTVFFNATQSTAGTGRRLVSYRWSFGDGASATGSTPTHVYKAAGTYVVVLRATDDVGQVGTATVEVTICTCP